MPSFDHETEEFYWLGLKAVPGIGNIIFRRLLETFGTPKDAFAASESELSSLRGITPSIISSIKNGAWKKFASEESARLAELQIRLVTFTSKEYPKSLFEIPDPPPFIYISGNIPASSARIAIVGSRKATSYGLMTTARLAEELSARNITVVSGMARGVDTAAHKGGINGAGSSIGVLGCGIDIVYPPENRMLFEDMASRGCLVSEFPLGTLPLAENFPRRNRIISGLSRGVLVVEATERSGSLITARYALDHGRDVFAVPGNINFATSRGVNMLIKQGAKLVDCVEDILEEIPDFICCPARPEQSFGDFSLTPREAVIYELLAHSPLHVDDIIRQTELTAPEVSSMLLTLELKGAVTPLPGKHYCISGCR